MFINQNNSTFGNKRDISSFIIDSLLTTKVKIKTIYSNWNGNNVESTHQHGKPNLRIGIPDVDASLKNDKVFFVLDYLSYNPINKQVEQRHLYPHRFMSRVYIGQSIDEEQYKDAKLFVDGNIVAKDFQLSDTDSSISTLITRITSLENELNNVKTKLNNIYKQDEFTNKISNRIPT